MQRNVSLGLKWGKLNIPENYAFYRYFAYLDTYEGIKGFGFFGDFLFGCGRMNGAVFLFEPF